ncbi:MAG TPA: hypothetical protein VMH31_00380 [Methylomirabilota bacterium]|nr:hypothetical protein [Methylomirabilota bacterium]HVM75321.1 hypothetical protein [Candidatus Saccharimonadales bacterium]
MSERYRLALLCALCCLAYGNTLANGFALDDGLYIARNSAVTHFSIPAVFQANKDANVFRPVTFATLALNWALGNTHPWGYHLVNLLLHALVAALLYLLLRKLFEGHGQSAWVALVAALLFAVHPIHTDAVASIVGRSELLAAGFVLAAWLLHLNDRPILSLLSFVAAVLSKESALVFVPLVLLGDYAREKYKSVLRYGCIVAVGLAYVAVLWAIQGGRFGQKQVPFTENPLAYLPAGMRILNALRVAWKYVGLQFYPFTLSCDYSFNSIPIYATWSHTALAAAAALAVMVVSVWALWTKRSQWSFAAGIYMTAFAVTANILIPTGTIMGERLAYLPSAGFCLFAALLLARMEQRLHRMAWCVLALVLVLLTARTIIRNRDWRDNFTLFQAAERAVPANASIHDGLAGEYQRRGNWAEADLEIKTTIQIYPDFPEYLRLRGIPEADFRIVNLAVMSAKAGDIEDALAFLNLAIERCPQFSLAWSNRAVLRYQRGDITAARDDAQNALRIDPMNVQAQNLLLRLSTASPAPLGNHR